MKKLIRIIVSLALVCTYIVPLNAQSAVLTQVQNYWLNNPELYGLDTILTVEALGLDVEDPKNNFVVNYDFSAPSDSYGNSVKYTEMDAGYLSKNIMAAAAMKLDPANLKLADGTSVNLIDILKSKIDEDGNVDYGGANPESGTSYTMYALAISDPTYDLTKLGAKLVQMQLADGSWGYNGAWGGPDMTGWALAALSLCGETYKPAIDKALNYYVSIQQDNGAYKGWDINCNSQACALWGLLEYDRQGIKNGTYDKGSGNPYVLLLQFMQADGSFGTNLDADEGNAYATVQAALTVGVYENGSLIENIAKQYDELLNPSKEVPVETPVLTPEVPVAPVDQTKKSVKTGDDVSIALVLSSLFISGLMYLYIKKES